MCDFYLRRWALNMKIIKKIKLFGKDNTASVEYAKKRAFYNINWWQAHHYGDESLIDYLSEDMAFKEGLPAHILKGIAIPYLMQAAKYHNLAEEDGVSDEDESKYWQLAEKSLVDYYTKIEELKQEYNKDKSIESVSALSFLASMSALGYMTFQGYYLAALAMLPVIRLYLDTTIVTNKWHSPKQQSLL